MRLRDVVDVGGHGEASKNGRHVGIDTRGDVMGRQRKNVPIADIVTANAGLLKELMMDESDAASCCWACRAECKTTKAHVRPVCDGGDDGPGNFFLLCDRCHNDQPDGAIREVQDRWVIDRESELDWVSREARGFWGDAVRLRRELASASEFLVKWIGTADVRALLRAGSASAAGIRNARANERAAVVGDLISRFDEWQLTREAQP